MARAQVGSERASAGERIGDGAEILQLVLVLVDDRILRDEEYSGSVMGDSMVTGLGQGLRAVFAQADATIVEGVTTGQPLVVSDLGTLTQETFMGAKTTSRWHMIGGWPEPSRAAARRGSLGGYLQRRGGAVGWDWTGTGAAATTAARAAGSRPSPLSRRPAQSPHR